jgi:hypothetical protein
LAATTANRRLDLYVIVHLGRAERQRPSGAQTHPRIRRSRRAEERRLSHDGGAITWRDAGSGGFENRAASVNTAEHPRQASSDD